MTKIQKIILIASLIFSLISIGISMKLILREKRTYFINNGKLYEGFTMKTEYENQLKNLRIQRKNMLDSVELTIRQLNAQNRKEESEIAQEYYLDKARKFEDEEATLLEEFDVQIWKRLNQYAIDFCKERNVDLMLGANGSGTVLHANESLDLTNELLAYSNKRYAGK
jgi:outer membrane protein